MITATRITGHLAMFQTVTASEPTPITWPTCFAKPPVRVTPTATAASISSIAIVVPTRVGRVFQIGRPSSTS